MGIIAKLKDVLGIADRPARPRRADSTDVTVEREADASTEEAIKGVETGSAEGTTTETAEAGAPETTSTAETEDPEPTATAGAEEEGTATEPRAGDPPEDGGEPVEAIKGIGSSYAERLGEAGVHTAADLAAADAEDLAEETGIGTGRIGNWSERARARNR